MPKISNGVVVLSGTATYCRMVIDVEEAKAVAERLLRDQLPRRWAHTQGVGERAHELWGVLGERTQVVEAAAWLHHIGYSPTVRSTGFLRWMARGI